MRRVMRTIEFIAPSGNLATGLALIGRPRVNATIVHIHVFLTEPGNHEPKKPFVRNKGSSLEKNLQEGIAALPIGPIKFIQHGIL
jgi:hypothetical protein